MDFFYTYRVDAIQAHLIRLHDLQQEE